MTRYTIQELNSMRKTKKEIIEGLNLRVFDYALPQTWLDEFVERNNLSYDIVLSTTVWCYDVSCFGYPVSACKEVQEIIDNEQSK